jgi:phage-related protein
MRLVRLGRVVWDVIAIAEDNGRHIMDELAAIDPSYKHAETMRVLISEFVPRNGPPRHNELRCKPLGDDIFEFKAGPKHGKKLRVLWFYDAGHVILCTHSFMKDTAKTPREEKDRAIRMRSAYFEAKNRNALPPIDD